MAVPKRVVELDLVPNNNEKSDTYGKYFARIHYIEPLNLRGVCDLIALSGSPYTRDIVSGVVTCLSTTIVRVLSEGQGVKLDGLGTLRPTLENTKGGAESPDAFNVNENVAGVHIRFIPEGEELDRITSREMKNNCVLRKTYKVSYTTIKTGGKEVQIPVYTPVKKEDPEEPTP